ncbi:hypothetical protein UCRNP2_653 [Neofusicoccum parvum UCRNP2]|uniref:Uncharacterized protein n=1 Tax=Botryosphaeria parva (strain UCR-NP2) TaxID=1287680 RepID=R1H2C3_BOTPV|nr:hypothetical protein UCRNP2_653 [Neofusicoccum parvum UCRNP2]
MPSGCSQPNSLTPIYGLVEASLAHQKNVEHIFQRYPDGDNDTREERFPAYAFKALADALLGQLDAILQLHDLKNDQDLQAETRCAAYDQGSRLWATIVAYYWLTIDTSSHDHFVLRDFLDNAQRVTAELIIDVKGDIAARKLALRKLKESLVHLC